MCRCARYTFLTTQHPHHPVLTHHQHQHQRPRQQEQLSAHEAASGGVAAERAALRADLERLLKERGTLDSLRRVVAAAMKAQQQQQQVIVVVVWLLGRGGSACCSGTV